MKKINLSFCPIKFLINYDKCKKQLGGVDEIILFSKYKTKIILSKTILNKVDITFIFENLDSIDAINEILFKEYGTPNSIRYGRTYTWKIDNIYLTHGEEETYYQDSKHIINISFVHPFISIDYSYYMFIDKNIKNIFNKWNIKKITQFISPSKSIDYFYETKDFRYVFIIKKGKITLGANEYYKEGMNTKNLVNWKEKTKFKSIKELEIKINSFLSYVEEYDINLKMNN